MGANLVTVNRGDRIESEHNGSIAVVDTEGKLLYGVGDTSRLTFARSSLKPLQTIPLIQSGAAERFLLSDKEIALCCGSHNGEEQHVAAVSLMLARLGLEEKHLQCGEHSPYDSKSHVQLLTNGESPSALHNNCSGKHTGMLAQALHLHSDISHYHLAEHPVQQRIQMMLCEMTGLEPNELSIGVDGCGIPTYGFPLHKLAHIYSLLSDSSRIVSPSLRQAVERIVVAMLRHPEMVGGIEVLCTDLMTVMQGKVIAKGGAEGVYCMGLMDRGIGIAIKVDDGNPRAAYPAAIETLVQLGVMNDEEKTALLKYHYPAIINRKDEIVGQIKPVFQL